MVYIVDQTGAVQVVHADGLGSTRALTDTSGQLLRTYQTDEFGVPSQREIAHPPNQPFQYTGEQRDYEFDLYYLRARMYDPQLGRFMQADPLRKNATGITGWNRFAYAADQATVLADPTGLSASAMFHQPCLPSLTDQVYCLPSAPATPTPGPTAIPQPPCPQSAGGNFFQEFVNGALVLGRGPEGGSNCHVNAQIPLVGGGDIVNFHIKFDKVASNFYAVVTGIIGLSLNPNVIPLGPSEPEAALSVINDLAGIVGVLNGEGGFDAAVQLYGRFLPRLTGALTLLRALS